MNTAEILNFPKEEAPVMKAELEDGYFRVANLLIEEMALADFSKREYKILLATMRKTYGFQKSTDQIALSQYADMTGLSKSAVSLALADLVAKNVLIKSNSRYEPTYKINTTVSSWILDRKPAPVYRERQAKEEAANYQNDNSQESNFQNDNSDLSKQKLGIIKTVTTKENLNKPLKKRESTKKNTRAKNAEWDAAFDRFYAAYPKKKNPATARRAWDKKVVSTGDLSLVDRILASIAEQKESEDWLKEGGRFIPLPASWLNAGAWANSSEVEIVEDWTDAQRPIVDVYNNTCGAIYGLLTVWTAARASRINNMLKRHPVEKWEKYFRFVRDENDFSSLTCPINFDFLTKPENYSNILAGDYRTKGDDYAR